MYEGPLFSVLRATASPNAGRSAGCVIGRDIRCCTNLGFNSEREQLVTFEPLQVEQKDKLQRKQDTPIEWASGLDEQIGSEKEVGKTHPACGHPPASSAVGPGNSDQACICRVVRTSAHGPTASNNAHPGGL